MALHETCPGCEVLEMETDNIREGAKGVKRFLVPRAVAEALAAAAAEADS